LLSPLLSLLSFSSHNSFISLKFLFDVPLISQIFQNGYWIDCSIYNIVKKMMNPRNMEKLENLLFVDYFS